MAEDKFNEPLCRATDKAKAAFSLAFDLGGIRYELKGRERFIPIVDVVVTKRASPPGNDIHLVVAREAVWRNVLKAFDKALGWKFIILGAGEPYAYEYSEGTTLLLSQQS